MKLSRAALAALLVALHGAALAQAPAWAAKRVHIVVSLSPGSATDILARTVAERLSGLLGHPVIVENRPGASTTIAAAFVAKAEPDGYTVLATSSAHTVAPFLYPALAYDTARDLAPAPPLANLPTVLVVPPSRGFRTLADLVAAARAKPGSINFGSAAASTQLNAERFRRSANIEAVHLPLKSPPEARLDPAGRADHHRVVISRFRLQLLGGPVRACKDARRLDRAAAPRHGCGPPIAGVCLGGMPQRAEIHSRIDISPV